MHWKKFGACVLVTLLAQLPASSRLLLKGEVQHSDSLPPVESSLAPGSTYDPRNLPAMKSGDANTWYRIPDWLAGDWHKDSQTDYYRYIFGTKETDTTTRVLEAKANGTWGLQSDSEGGIWHFDPVPFTTTVDGGDDFIVQLVRVSEPLESSPERFVKRSVNTQIRVEKASRNIKAVESGEQITVYCPESDNLLKRETSSKVFDNQGNPVVLGKSFSYEKRTAPFQPRDRFLGKDMKTLFADFMKSRDTAINPPQSKTND